ncbi:hypothetical protein LMG27174_06070 [Paraburkholderia rhynchosiae]|uniref:Uncharacterized protein n=1 Tax=Paraburkholderia rhynchosiae TaxID=487049 RepID=A0A6J5CCV0_9BURK|nr:hypothetical protein LMG27174_06070 [Paraburkholderia rhynchosiae]
MVVIVDVVFDAGLQLVEVAKPVQMEEFRLERSKKLSIVALSRQFPLRDLVIDSVTLAPNGSRDSTASIAAFVLLKERADTLFQAHIFVPGLQYLLLVIESAAGQAGHFKDGCERLTLP